MVSQLSGNSFILEGNSVPFPTSSDFLAALKTLSYRDASGNALVGLRTVRITIFDSEAISTTFTIVIRVKIEIDLGCPGLSRDADVVFLFDSSTTSSSPVFWNNIISFASQVMNILPIARERTRF